MLFAGALVVAGAKATPTKTFLVDAELGYVEFKRRVLREFGVVPAAALVDDAAVLRHDHEIFVVDALDGTIIGDLRTAAMTPYQTDARLRLESLDVKYVLRAVADAVADADAELLAATELPSVSAAAAAAIAATSSTANNNNNNNSSSSKRSAHTTSSYHGSNGGGPLNDEDYDF